MDFINGCTTNVHVLDNFLAIPFIQYQYSALHGDDDRKIKDVQKAIVALRESKVLCTLVDQDIWLFGHSEHELGEEYSVMRKGVVDLDKDINNHLLDAIESALAYALAVVDDFIHIAPWTWLYCNRRTDGEGDASIITLRVDDRTWSGSLYVLSDVKSTTWTPIDRAENYPNDEVFLAPRGRIAQLTEADGNNVAANAHWKSHVLDALRLEGITLDEDAEWTDVEFVDDGVKSAFAWPSRLCLVREDPRLNPELTSTEWKNVWTDNGQGRVYQDPLAEAEEWFTGSAERKIRAAEEATNAEARIETNAPTGPASTGLSNAMTSPPFMQRTADQQAAMSGIYPTPPDGLAQQGHMPLGPPTGMSAATPSVVQPGDTATTADNDIMNDTQDVSRDSLDLDVDAYSMDEVEEDLFGDVGGGIFEENEVGDADFDYFDEPDDMPAAAVSAQGAGMTMADDPTQDVQIDAGMDDALDDSGPYKGELPQHPESVTAAGSSPPSALLPMEIANDTSHEVAIVEDRALSPFGIRERLLPPPVPASFAHSNGEARQIRRSSSFAPIVFRDGVDLGAKYAKMDLTPDTGREKSSSGPSIALPLSKTNNESDDSDDSEMSDGEEDDVELPPRLPWETSKKRKRSWEMNESASTDWAEENGSVFQPVNDDEQQRDLQRTLLDRLLHPASPIDIKDLTNKLPSDKKAFKHEDVKNLPSLKDLYDLTKEDLIYIAQLISEQASTCLTPSPSPHTLSTGTAFALTQLIKALTILLPTPLEPCDLPRLAMTRDPAPPPRMAAQRAAPLPPRPGPEVPDIFPLPAPFIRLQRNNDDWEMLPPALSFWEPNGLAAASGPKDIRVRAIFPSNPDLRMNVRDFMGALSRVFEGGKLGSHLYDIWDEGEFDDGAGVEVDDARDGEGAVEALLRGYARTCVGVGREMAGWTIGPGRFWRGCFVVYVVDPFSGIDEGGGREGGGGGAIMRKYLCACFWMLWQAYRTRMRSGSVPKPEDFVPDVVLQILPIGMIASGEGGGMVVPDEVMLGRLAREVHDRCPPAFEGFETEDGVEGGGSAAAPSILLAPPIPKRIAFQLAADVMTESLLMDGKVLHLAVAGSKDGMWIVAVWGDGQGRVLMRESFCLRGKMVKEVLREIWARTGEVLGRWRVGWRVFICVDDEGGGGFGGMERVWRDVVSSGGGRGGMTVCVTLVRVHRETGVKVIGDAVGSGEGVGGLVTPASTPVAFSNSNANGNSGGGGGGIATGTNSPNIGSSSAADGFGNAPLTPAGSETPTTAGPANAVAAAMQLAESDPDAHLVDVEDESCGVVFKPQFSLLTGMEGMASGAIIRKGGGRDGNDNGGGGGGRERGMLGVCVLWTLQVKASPNGQGNGGGGVGGGGGGGGNVEVGSARQAELTLREVLRMFRSLGVLTRARGLDSDEGGAGGGSVRPVFLAVAMQGARGLEGFFD